ncbi:hypothetical protein NGR_b07470 (plasmid) [Sinorhizobium fredii NGR234]|uniref:histidine kinase n=2 Tax=Rhizobium fredii TaxID=380 RepID=C3KQ47_SINFN|nr:hypothetical protein NGR_b07470 [Sinorhizobium fredii NGR234]
MRQAAASGREDRTVEPTSSCAAQECFAGHFDIHVKLGVRRRRSRQRNRKTPLKCHLLRNVETLGDGKGQDEAVFLESRPLRQLNPSGDTLGIPSRGTRGCSARPRRMEAQQRTMMGELHYRVKNDLASVNALAMRSLNESRSLDEFRNSFATRLGALSRTQDLLMRAPERDVLMAEVLRLELQARAAMRGKITTLTVPTSPCRARLRKHLPWRFMNWRPMP